MRLLSFQNALQSAPTSEEDAKCLDEWGVSLAEEAELVAQLMEEASLETAIPPELNDFYTLRRFLRARKHDVYKAKIMLISTINWRRQVGADSILKDFVFHEKEKFHEHYPEGFYGVDRDGRPVYIQKPGAIDCTKLWEFTTLERSIQYHISQQERYVNILLPAASIASEKILDQSTVIIDMEGVSVSTLTGEVRKIMQTVMQIDQDYYPELMDKCLIINAPTTFRIIFGMVKYFLDSRTQTKIHVLPANYREDLLKYISPENLEVRYGGSNPLPLSAEPGPWQDPDILKQVEQNWDVMRRKY